MSYTLVSEEEAPDPASSELQRASPPKPAPNYAPFFNAVKVAVLVLNARLLLLFALFGAFFLSWQAVSDPSTLRIAASTLYNILVLLPMVWLSARG